MAALSETGGTPVGFPQKHAWVVCMEVGAYLYSFDMPVARKSDAVALRKRLIEGDNSRGIRHDPHEYKIAKVAMRTAVA